TSSLPASGPSGAPRGPAPHGAGWRGKRQWQYGIIETVLQAPPPARSRLSQKEYIRATAVSRGAVVQWKKRSRALGES
ncbi:hypothetical protein C1T30_43380, partial [Bacillus sp. MBGLi97]